MAAKRITVFGILISTALVFSYIEYLFPLNNAFPGVKLGFSNIVVLFAIYKLKPSEAFIIAVIKILISGLLFGGPTVLLFSLCGGLLSFVVMLISKRVFGVIVVGVLGGVFHNIGQLIACYYITNASVVFLMPILIVSGLLTGIITGSLSGIVIKRVKI